MTANPSKFQSLIVGKNDSYIKEFQIDNEFNINVNNEVTLLGIHINQQLQFDSHIHKICSKAAMHLNTMTRLAKFMGSKEREVIVNSFILYHFNYRPYNLVILQQCKSKETRENQQELPKISNL